MNDERIASDCCWEDWIEEADCYRCLKCGQPCEVVDLDALAALGGDDMSITLEQQASSLLDACIAAEAERREMRARVAELKVLAGIEPTRISAEINQEGGTIEAAYDPGWLTELCLRIGEAMLSAGAANFFEQTMELNPNAGAQTQGIQRFTLTIQRAEGETPGMQCRRLRERVTELEARIALLEAVVEAARRETESTVPQYYHQNVVEALAALDAEETA